LLNNDQLVGAQLSPITFDQSHTELDLSLGLKLATHNSQLSAKVAQLVDSVTHSKEVDGSDTITVTGITLSPQGVNSGPAVIDQFKNIKISLPISTLLSKKGDSNEKSGPPLVDTSSLLTHLNMKDLGLKPHNIDVETQPKSTLALSAQVDYNNQSPVSIKIPFLETSLDIEGIPFIEPSLSGLEFIKGSRAMAPQVKLQFPPSEAIQNQLSKLVSSLEMSQRPSQKLNVNGLIFGGSQGDINDLFSQVKVDISPLLADLKLPNLSSLASSSSSVSTQAGPAPMIHGVVLKALPEKRLDLAAHVDLALQLPLTAKIGTAQAGVQIDSSPLIKASLGSLILEANHAVQNLNLNAQIQFQEDDQTPTRVAKIAQAIQTQTKPESVVALNQLQLGYSPEDQVTFQLIGIPHNAMLMNV
jgi:hypothetical protein